MSASHKTQSIRRRSRRSAWRLRFIAASTIVVCGCGHGEGRLFDLHMANDPKAQAKARWESVRGSVKLQLAEEHLKAGRIEAAERALEEALALCPNQAKAYVLATRLRLEQGQLAEAREAITVAATLNDSDPEIPYFAGLVAQRYGDLESANDHFTAASTAAPQVAAYVLARVETLVNIDRPVDAMELLQSRLNDFDQNVSMRMLAARIYRILGLRGPAVAYCREAVRIGDEAPHLVAELGLMLVWAERYRDAVAVLAPVIEPCADKTKPSEGKDIESNDPQSPSVVRSLARAYIETGEGQKAIDVLRRLLAANPDDTLSWSLCARAALMLDNVAAAEEALGRVEAKGSTTAENLVMSAYTALRRGDFTRAQSAASKALKLDGRFATAHCLAGQAAEALGETDAALASYEAVLEIDPESPIAKHRIEALGGEIEATPVETPNDPNPGQAGLEERVGSACPPEEAVP